jgi:hypothetical protein
MMPLVADHEILVTSMVYNVEILLLWHLGILLSSDFLAVN